MQLSTRLETIIHMVPPCSSLADIGCDHGFVSIELVKRGICSRVIASDINAGPLEQAKKHIQAENLAGKIDCRLGGGLTTISEGEAETLLIAGMGGQLIKSILLDSTSVTASAKTLVLSPHRDSDAVRACLSLLGFTITDESMLEEEGKFYVIIRAEKQEEKQVLSDSEILYGPCLIQKKDPVFLKYLNQERSRLLRLLENLKNKQDSESVLAARKNIEDTLRILNQLI